MSIYSLAVSKLMFCYSLCDCAMTKLKFEKWLGGERGLRLAPDSQNFSSVSGVCAVPSADNPEEDCRYTEGEHDEQNAFLHISVSE